MTIRVGIIGLPAKGGAYVPGVWASMAHLPPLKASPSFEIVALANSTAEAAQKSIQYHNLPPTTAAYGSAKDLAEDPNVDLVVISVRVQKHFELVEPALQQGKAVFVEWPLGASLEESERLTEMAQKAGVKTMVGVQARGSYLVSATKKILAEGKIGRVVSSHVMGNMSMIPVDEWWEGYEFYLDMNSGGNSFYIYFAHFLDSFIDVLGDFETLQSILASQRPTVPIISQLTGQVVNPAHPRTSPDHIMVQGRLESGVVASISFRHTQSSADSAGIKWLISGTDGEIEITVPEKLVGMDSQWQKISSFTGARLRTRLGKEPEAKEVDFTSLGAPEGAPAWVSNLDAHALNTGLLYEAFARDDENRFATFETALKTHRLLDRIAKASGM